MTRGSRRTSSGGPRRSACRSRARRPGRRRSSTSPMSWSMSSIGVPASAIARSRRPSSCSRRCRARPPARRGRHARPHGERARHADELALTLRELGRHRVGEPRPGRAARARPRRRRRSRRAADELAHDRQATAARRRREVLAHGEVVEQLARLPRAGEPAARALVRRQAARSRPSSSTRPRSGAKPVIASTNVVLPAPFGPDQPDELPAPTSSVDVAERVHAAEARPRGRAVSSTRAHGAPPARRAARRSAARRPRAAGVACAAACRRRRRRPPGSGSA